MHAWLVSLTRAEDPLLWTWVAIVLGHVVVGGGLGWAARRRRAGAESPVCAVEATDSTSR